MTAPLLRCTDLWFSYGDTPPVLRGINLEIHRGEAIALIGQNGSGKTTLAKQMNGLLHPDQGHVELDGIDTRQATTGELASRAGYVFQNPDHQIFSPSVEKEIAFGPENLGLSGEHLDRRVEEAMERFGLGEYRNRHPTLLGRGLRRRVAIASVYALNPSLMILDEPTGGLDHRRTAELLVTLREIIDEDRTVILISHDMRLVGEFAERLLIMHDGRLIGDGPVHALLPDEHRLRHASLAPPEITRLSIDLAENGFHPSVNLDEFIDQFRNVYRAPFTANHSAGDE
jgi:energy-coupling factor transporter ATP-binding protein EcfA2